MRWRRPPHAVAWLGLFALAGSALAADPAGAAHRPGLDGTFGSGGRVLVDAAAASGRTHGIARRPHGGYVTAGNAVIEGDRRIGLLATTVDGRPDPAFGESGTASPDLPTSAEHGRALTVLPGGRILVAGSATEDLPHTPTSHIHPEMMLAARYTASGTLDTTFGTGGAAYVPFQAGNSAAQAVAALAGGRIAIAGAAVDGQAVAVAVLDSAGRLDARFGTQGRLVLDLLGGRESIHSIAAEPDGRLMIAGGTPFGTTFVARLRADGGGLDPGFARDGLVRFPSENAVSGVPGLERLPDGRLVALGRFGGVTGLLALTADGLPDPAFGDAGLAALAPGATGALRLERGRDGELWVAMERFDVISRRTDLALAPYTAAGRPAREPLVLDFATAGIRHLTPGGLVAEPDGRVALVARAVDTEEHGHAVLARALPAVADPPAPTRKARRRRCRAGRRWVRGRCRVVRKRAAMRSTRRTSGGRAR